MREPFVQAILIGAPLDAAYAAAIGVVAVMIRGAWWESLR